MRTFQIIKIRSHSAQSIATVNGTFEVGSPFEVMSIAKKLQRKAVRNGDYTIYRIEPPVCPDCECPFVSVDGGTWGFCQCDY